MTTDFLLVSSKLDISLLSVQVEHYKRKCHITAHSCICTLSSVSANGKCYAKGVRFHKTCEIEIRHCCTLEILFFSFFVDNKSMTFCWGEIHVVVQFYPWFYFDKFL